MLYFMCEKHVSFTILFLTTKTARIAAQTKHFLHKGKQKKYIGKCMPDPAEHVGTLGI